MDVKITNTYILRKYPVETLFLFKVRSPAKNEKKSINKPNSYVQYIIPMRSWFINKCGFLQEKNLIYRVSGDIIVVSIMQNIIFNI